MKHRFLMSEIITKQKIAFVVGRPSGHPLHMAYANSVHADIIHEDSILRWQDVPTAGKLRRYASWLLNAFFFKNRKKYDIFLCECLRVPPLILKSLGLMRRNQKLAALMADESLYFLDQHKYPAMTQWLIRLFLKKCDYVIGIGTLQYELALKHVPKGHENKVRLIPFNGLDADTLQRLLDIPTKTGIPKRLLIVGNMSAYWRAWYKGVDLSFAAFQKLCEQYDLYLDIIGATANEVEEELLSNMNSTAKSRIKFLGEIKDIPAALKSYDICLHPARGDAFPTSTLECYAAGIPTVVSVDTGTKAFAKKVDDQLVCELNEDSVTASLKHVLDLDTHELEKVSSGLKKVVSGCTREAALQNFKDIIRQTVDSD